MNEQQSGLISVNITEEEKKIKRYGDAHIRDFSSEELMQFCEHMIRVIARVPASTIMLDTVATLSAADRTGEAFSEPTCGTTFCVFGWALADKDASDMLCLNPRVVDATLEAYDQNRFEVDFYTSFYYGNGFNAAEFMFSGRVTSFPEKLEALARLAIVHASIQTAIELGEPSMFFGDSNSSECRSDVWDLAVDAGHPVRAGELLRKLCANNSEVIAMIDKYWQKLIDGSLHDCDEDEDDSEED